MLLMVATNRRHELPAVPDSKDGLQGAFFSLVDPRPPAPPPPAQHHAPGPPPPPRGPGLWRGLSSWDFPGVDQALWVGKGVVGRVGLWEGGAAPALFADAPEAIPDGPPTCPFHPTFLSRSAPNSDLAVMEIAEQSMLWDPILFVGSVHQIEIFNGDNVDAESEIQFAMLGVAPPVRLTTPWYLLNTAPAWRSPKCSKVGAWSITCPCDCKVCLLVCLLSLLPNWTKLT